MILYKAKTVRDNAFLFLFVFPEYVCLGSVFDVDVIH